MKNTIEKKYPPYNGNEPYIYLCFSAKDENEVKPLIHMLYERGCRIWYTAKKASGLKEEETMHERMSGAGLVIAYISPNLNNDTAKNNLMYLQGKGHKVIAVGNFSGSSNKGRIMASGLHEDTAIIDSSDGIDDIVEGQIISSDGFSQKYIGQRQRVKSSTPLKLIFAAVMAMIAVVTAYIIFLSGSSVYLYKVPKDLSFLEKYSNIETVIIPQKEAEDAGALLDNYTVVLKE